MVDSLIQVCYLGGLEAHNDHIGGFLLRFC
jgi:hypothetical protein